MALILRIDVDKPYGSNSITAKVLSKVRENYWFPVVSAFGYLDYLREFLYFLSEENISGHIYFRKCTLPPKSWLYEPLFKKHMIGLHAENTRSLETFKKEYEYVKDYIYPINLNSFSKHGSGVWKGGRHHYPPYEPDKYIEWADILGISFYFGNLEMQDESSDIQSHDNYYPRLFWIDRLRNYANPPSIPWLVETAKRVNIGVLLHPGFFLNDSKVNHDVKQLFSLAKREDVPWITL